MRTLFLGASVAALVLFADVRQDGTITVSATDPSGGPLSGVEVQARHETSGATRRAITDAQGHAVLTLPPGTYTIICRLINFAPIGTEGVAVGSGASATATCVFGHDQITLTNNIGSDEAVVLVDGRRAGCFDDELHRGDTSIDLTNVYTRQSCRSEVAVFSDDNAMALVENVSSWTDQPGDMFTIDLGPLIHIPIDIWVVAGSFPDIEAQAIDAVAVANTIYNEGNCGITFDVQMTDATSQAVAGTSYNGCSYQNNVTTDIGFTPNRVNIYYVNGPLTSNAAGRFCGFTATGTGAMIFIDIIKDHPIVLGHELGHAFSLDHVDNLDLDNNGSADFQYGLNLMYTGGIPGVIPDLTEGQCFRCNVNDGPVGLQSYLNTSGYRTGPTRVCADTDINDACPILTFQVDPPN